MTVFEAINGPLGEICIGTTTLPMHQLGAQYARNPPAAIAHWRKEHKVHFHSLEFDLTPAEARRFIDGYAREVERERWKVLRRVG